MEHGAPFSFLNNSRYFPTPFRLRSLPKCFFTVLLVGLPLILSAEGVSAQSLQEEPVREQSDRAIQLDQQRNAERRRELERQRRERTGLPVDDVPTPVDIEAGGPCFTVAQIELKGVRQFTVRQQQRITQPFIGQCVGKPGLNKLLQAITQRYFAAGYVTSRAYVAPQNFSDGHLDIQVVEGQLEKIQFSAIDTPVALSTAFPGLTDKVLNLRDIEQGLEQINRLASRSATLDLLPGSELAETVLQLNVQTQKPVSLRMGVNNSGQSSTGEQQQSLFVSIDNPLRLNDYAYLSIQADTKDDSEGKKSESISVYWDIPYGYWLLSLDASRFKYESIVAGNFSDFFTLGNSENQKVTVWRTVHRDNNNKVKLGLSLTRKKTENFIEDTLIETSSRTLAIAELSLHQDQYFKHGGVLVSSMAYQRGLDTFGSPDDDDVPAGNPKAQFEKFKVSLDYTLALKFLPRAVRWQSRLTGQYSGDALFGSEQISIGSEYTVRGYKQSSISSNIGAYWRNSLAADFSPASIGFGLKSIRTTLSYDVGVIRDRFYSGNKYERLQGWGLGLGFYGEYLSANVTYARPINVPDYLSVAQEQFYFSINVNY